MANTTNKTLCKVGRSFDPAHVSCISCVKQLGACAEGKKTRRVTEAPRFWTRGDILVTTATLWGLNRWNNKPRYHYTAERKRWESLLIGTWALWGKAVGKRRLIVTRFVASKGHLITDDTNLIGALKPLEDALVKYGILVDDDKKYLDATITQSIDKDNPRTEIGVYDDL